MGSPRSRSVAVLLFALTAALRVFLFSAAFPPFDNVDEEAHFDHVLRYAAGTLPGEGLALHTAEASDTIARFETSEYLHPPEAQPALWRTPRWKRTDPAAAAEIETLRAFWSAQPNHESQSSPLYYALAGSWSAAGKGFGIRGGQLVYWIRLLNVLLVASTVVLAHRFFGRHFPDRPLLRLGVPFLLAFLPQDAQYSIGPDVLSAPLGILALDGLLVWTASSSPSARGALATGLALAAACLVKLPNVVLLPVAAAILWLRPRPLREIAVAAAAAGVPILLWTSRTTLLTGGAAGASDVVAALGWTPKPLGQVLGHPILTPSGLWAFLAPLIKTSWRGEFNWHGQRLASSFADGVYVGSTILLAVLGTVALLRGSRKKAGGEREAAIACVSMPVLSVLLLAAISMAFDFGDYSYPSREKPYFISGRLLSASLVPFLGVYVAGLDVAALGRARRIVAWSLLVVVAAIATASEGRITAEVFRSPFNAFHGVDALR